jgi:fluoroacetyl-CoA thioesterase
MTTLEPGLTAKVELLVAADDTASAFASGAVAVLATPRLIGLLEEAAFLAAQPALAEGQTTVGTRIDVRHLAATPVGMQVTASAELVEVAERLLRFHVRAYDTYELVMDGMHERTIVNLARFLERVARKVAT